MSTLEIFVLSALDTAMRLGRDCPVLDITPEEVAALPEYSCSVPTGACAGKRWKYNPLAYFRDPARHVDAFRYEDKRFLSTKTVWLVREFVSCDDDPSYVTIKTFRPKNWT